MGHWGTGISSNDTFMEVYENYFHLYNNNEKIEDIKNALIKHYSDTINESQTAHDFWFALAKALWECKASDKEIFNKVKKIVESGADLEVWKDLDASEKDIKARKTVLEKFLAMISVEKPKPKARKKIRLYSGVYEKGQCLAFKMKDFRYGGMVVVEREIDTPEGENYIVATNIDMDTLPTMDDFAKAKVLTVRETATIGDSVYNREFFRVFSIEAKEKRYNKDIDEKLIKAGVLPVKAAFNKYFQPSHGSNDWTLFPRLAEEAIIKIRNGEKENISATIHDWINKSAAENGFKH